MFQVEMAASVRNVSGKGPMRQLRMKGITPAVVYGGGGEAVKLQFDTKTLMAQLLEFYRRNTVVTLKIDGASGKSVMIGEVQTDPVRDTLVHVDFCELDLEKTRSYTVPIVYKGIAKGVDLGGDMMINHDKVVLEGRPLNIPDECVVDVTALGIGDSVKCGEIVVPENVKMVTDAETLAVSIIKPGQKVVVAE
jgi:large subunit ribosomal protein L25